MVHAALSHVEQLLVKHVEIVPG